MSEGSAGRVAQWNVQWSHATLKCAVEGPEVQDLCVSMVTSQQVIHVLTMRGERRVSRNTDSNLGNLLPCPPVPVVPHTSCRGRCYEPYDGDVPGCRCDKNCNVSGSCCHDYHDICSAPGETPPPFIYNLSVPSLVTAPPAGGDRWREVAGRRSLAGGH